MFLECNGNVFPIYTEIWAKTARIHGVFMLRSKPVQQNYLHFFKDFKQKSALYRLIRLRLLVKMFLMDIILPPFFQKITNQRMHSKGSWG